MLGEQGVEPVDHDLLLPGRGCLEHRAQITLKTSQDPAVAVSQPRYEPVTVGEQVGQIVGSAHGVVDQLRAALGVTDEVHVKILRGPAML